MALSSELLNPEMVGLPGNIVIPEIFNTGLLIIPIGLPK
jgi:hypothetical protein